MKCKNCGAEISNDEVKCPYCGVAIEFESNNKEYVNKSNHTFDEEIEGKSRLAAILFAFLLAPFGAHQFYLGHPWKGILCILFMWTGIPEIISFIQGIIMIIESDEQFAKRINKK